MIYRFYSNPIQGARVTVVAELDGEWLRIACARCSPRDNFVRRKGRTIAEGRLKKNKLYSLLKISNPDEYRPLYFISFALATANEVAVNKKPVTR